MDMNTHAHMHAPTHAHSIHASRHTHRVMILFIFQPS